MALSLVSTTTGLCLSGRGNRYKQTRHTHQGDWRTLEPWEVRMACTDAAKLLSGLLSRTDCSSNQGLTLKGLNTWTFSCLKSSSFIVRDKLAHRPRAVLRLLLV